jgi:hypothetical protein
MSAHIRSADFALAEKASEQARHRRTPRCRQTRSLLRRKSVFCEEMVCALVLVACLAVLPWSARSENASIHVDDNGTLVVVLSLCIFGWGAASSAGRALTSVNAL